MAWFFAIVALIGGVAVGLQGATNAALKDQSSLASALVLNGGIVLGLVLLLAAFEPNFLQSLQRVTQASPKLWLGGVYGTVILACAIFAIPRLGAANTLIFFIFGQLVTASIVDHYGLLGVEKSPVGLKRILGVALVFVGAILARK